MSVYRLRYGVAGGHVHCALFVAPAPNLTYAKCGDFIVGRGEDFICLQRCLSGVEFLPELASDGPDARSER